MPSIQLPHDPQRHLSLLSSSRFDLPTVHAMMTEQFTNTSLFDTFIFNGQEFIKGHQWAFSLSQLSQSGIIMVKVAAIGDKREGIRDDIDR